jgi:hypothetical protein
VGKRVAGSRTPNPASPAELARRAGLNRSSISRLLAGKLKAALLPDGTVDCAHPVVEAWARSKGIHQNALLESLPGLAPRADRTPPNRGNPPAAPAAAPTKSRKRPAEGADDPTDDRPDDDDGGGQVKAEAIESYSDLSIRQISERFGTFKRFADQVDALKKVVEIRKIQLANEEVEGTLISRDLVQTQVMAYLNALSLRLLKDSARTIVRRVYALSRSDTGMEEAEEVVREIIGSQIQPVKDKASRVLRNA